MHFCVKCRLDMKYPLCKMFKLFICAVCQVEIKPDEGISIHVGSSDFGKLRPWDGPFLCSSCQEKKEAMEGKRPPGGTNSSSLWVFFSFCSLKSRSTFMLTDFPFHLGSILQIGIAVIVISQPSLILFAFGKH